MSDDVSVFLVAGEESGDLLGGSLMAALSTNSQKTLKFSGVGGKAMEQQGMNSLFDINDIAVMGFSAVISRLPKILKRIQETADAAIREKPNLIVLIDSPDFTHRVAKKVRAKLPDVPIIKYVCPSVWAWRSHRAAKMRDYVDHILAILPFEPKVLKELNGPEATYVGHPLRSISGVRSAIDDDSRTKLLLLPGSRMGEIKRLLPLFKDTVDILLGMRPDLELSLVAVEKHRAFIEHEIGAWQLKPTIIGQGGKKEALEGAHAALAASGTVLLELALYKVPMISTYRLDPIARQLRSLMTSWSACLPNLILGYPTVSEYVDEHARAPLLARHLNRLLSNTPEREAQLDAFDELQQLLALEGKTSASEKAAEVCLKYLN